MICPICFFGPEACYCTIKDYDDYDAFRFQDYDECDDILFEPYPYHDYDGPTCIQCDSPVSAGVRKCHHCVDYESKYY